MCCAKTPFSLRRLPPQLTHSRQKEIVKKENVKNVTSVQINAGNATKDAENVARRNVKEEGTTGTKSK